MLGTHGARANILGSGGAVGRRSGDNGIHNPAAVAGQDAMGKTLIRGMGPNDKKVSDRGSGEGFTGYASGTERRVVLLSAGWSYREDSLQLLVHSKDGDATINGIRAARALDPDLIVT